MGCGKSKKVNVQEPILIQNQQASLPPVQPQIPPPSQPVAVSSPKESPPTIQSGPLPSNPPAPKQEEEKKSEPKKALSPKQEIEPTKEPENPLYIDETPAPIEIPSETNNREISTEEKPIEIPPIENLVPVEPKPEIPEEVVEEVKNETEEPLESSKKLTLEQEEQLIIEDDFKKSTQYNILVWAANKDLLIPFREHPTSKVSIAKHSVELDFTFFPIVSSTSKHIPTIIDCIIFIVNEIEKDQKSLLSLNENFPSVWSKKVLCENIDELVEKFSESNNLLCFEDRQELYTSIYEDDLKLFHLIKEVFHEIDKDTSGFIDIKEMAHAAELLKKPVSDEDLEMAMNEMDLNADGKISFEEFVYWWKRGREGAKSVHKLAGKWAHNLSAKIPGSQELLSKLGVQKRGINRKIYEKSLSLNFGPPVENPGISVDFSVGKSEKREQIVNTDNKILNFQIYELWVSFCFTTKSEVSSELKDELREFCRSQINSAVAASYDGSALEESIGFQIESQENKLFFGLWADINSDLLETELSSLNYIDQLLETPVDDFIEVSMESSQKISDLTGEGTLVEYVNKGLKIGVKMAHWTKLEQVLSGVSQGFSKKLALLFYLQGKVDFYMKEAEDLPEFVEKAVPNVGAGMLLGELKAGLGGLVRTAPMFELAFEKLRKELKDELSVVFRYKNIGTKLEIKGEGLFGLLDETEDIINERVAFY